MSVDHLRTLDILLWSGKGAFSNIIKAGQWLTFPAPHWRISHVGLVIRAEDLRGVPDWQHLVHQYAGQVLTLESTTLAEVPDIVTGERFSGVGLYVLEDRIRTANSQVWARQWQRSPSPEAKRNAVRWAYKHHGTPYERKLLQLTASALGYQTGLNGEDTSTMFCSEVDTEVLEHVGLMDESKQDSDAMCPAEISMLGLAEGQPVNTLLLGPTELEHAEAA